MKVQAMILGHADITTKTTNKDGLDVVTGSVKLLVSDPSQIIDVSITEDQIKAGDHTKLKELVGRGFHEYAIEWRDSSWGDNSGRHRTYSGFRLVSLPPAAPAKG